jgi:hypothetical protein
MSNLCRIDSYLIERSSTDCGSSLRLMAPNNMHLLCGIKLCTSVSSDCKGGGKYVRREFDSLLLQAGSYYSSCSSSHLDFEITILDTGERASKQECNNASQVLLDATDCQAGKCKYSNQGSLSPRPIKPWDKTPYSHHISQISRFPENAEWVEGSPL